MSTAYPLLLGFVKKTCSLECNEQH